jgi:hypothetical protein
MRNDMSAKLVEHDEMSANLEKKMNSCVPHMLNALKKKSII